MSKSKKHKIPIHIQDFVVRMSGYCVVNVSFCSKRNVYILVVNFGTESCGWLDDFELASANDSMIVKGLFG